MSCVFACICTGLACGQSSPLNVAALQGTDVQFMCTKQAADGSTAIITWNLLPMSQRNNNPWQETTVAIAGNVILSQSKYTVTTSGNIETLHIPNVTREDAAVVECHRVNDVKKRAQLVILGEYSRCFFVDWHHLMNYRYHLIYIYLHLGYRQVSNIRRTLIGNEIVDNSDVVGASPVGAAPTTSSLST